MSLARRIIRSGVANIGKAGRKIAYILNNPVRKGLAQSPEEYRWL